MTVKNAFLSLMIGLIATTGLLASEQRSSQRLEKLLKQLDDLDAAPGNSSKIESLRHKIDAEAGQRYAWASRLFWHTDLEQAKVAAEKLGKPILSLRLLGNLTDELSCANSRYFRTVLYANQEISDQLRDAYVLHWSSERPVPVLTVDFGDGRVMKRTVTGNSIHYLLDSNGAPLDAMPGLVSPKAFSDWLTISEGVYKIMQASSGKSRTDLIRQIQQAHQMRQSRRWQQDLAKLRQLHPEVLQWTAAGSQDPLRRQDLETALQRAVAAESAVTLAAPKRAAELRFIPHLTLSGKPIPEGLENNTAFWKSLAKLYFEEVRLDEASRSLIAHQRPYAYQQGEEAFQAMLTEFRNNLALDTVRNQYLLQRKLRNWLIAGPMEFADLNQRVYSELFLTPRQDPYLGLMPANAYSGLEQGGLVDPPASQAATVSRPNSQAGG